MSIIGSNILAGAAGSGVEAYEVEQSLRFNSADSHYLNRTPSSKGNATTWTWSGWVKLGATSNTYNKLFHAYYGNSSRYFILQFVRGGSYDYLQAVGGLYSTSATSEIINLQTTQKFRDLSAWYHIVFVYDSGNATSSDRCKLYINGTRVTAFNTAVYPSQNNETFVNQSTTPHYLGSSSSSECLDGYLAEVNFIDGSALDHEDFGELDDNGVWRPIQYAGSYTGQSWYLKFASGDGTDSSGLSNTWTANNFTSSAPGNGRYAPDCSTVSGGGSFVRAFDGSISTGVGSENYSGEIWTWEPDTAYSYSTSVEIYGGEAAYDQARINGGSWQALNGGWKTLASGSGSITKIEVRDSRGNAAASFNAFRVDGTFLVDNVYNVTYDVVPDTPTNNWSTMNPLHNTGTNGSQDGNLVIYSSTTAHRVNTGTISLSSQGGKYYAECWVHTTTRLSDRAAGFGFQVGPNLNGPTGSNNYIIYSNNNQGRISANGSTLANNIGAAMARDGDVYQLAFDAATGKAWVGMNNTWLNSTGGSTGDPATGANATFTLSGDVYTFASAYNNTVYVNFGQHDFVYDPPTGFDSVNTANMTEPEIADGSEYFNTVTYTGDGSYPRAVTGVGFSPDWVWLKSRSDSYGHGTYDRVRGVGTSATALRIDGIGQEGSSDIGPSIDMDSFDSDGFTLGNTVSGTELFNLSTKSYVAWNWKADNTSGSSNTAGTLTSTVSALPEAGFSIVSWTAGVGGGTVGHGLGKTPNWIIMKTRDSIDSPWFVYTTVTGIQTYGDLQSTNSIPSSGTAPTAFSTAPTDTLFNPGTGVTSTNSYNKMIAYCFAEVEGYSKFGSYEGNGNNDGVFIYLGFKPKWFMLKRIDVDGGDWVIMDDERSPVNVMDDHLMANSSLSERVDSTETDMDFLSNGVKLRNSNNKINYSGQTFVYAAFAENPFGGSGVSPATAR